MRRSISKYDPNTEFLTPERCYITELANSDTDPDCSIALARVPPGVTTQLHSIDATLERYVILQGAGMVEIDGSAAQRVERLDVVNIPSEMSQRITNVASEDLLLLCICTPRFRPSSYINLEEEA